MPPFPVRMEMFVCCADASCDFRLDTELPFVPFPGLEITIRSQDEDPQDEGWKVSDVIWQMHERRFLVVMERWDDPRGLLQEWIDDLAKDGWCEVPESRMTMQADKKGLGPTIIKGFENN